MTRYDAPPFVFIDGDGDDVADFSGITPSLIAVRGVLRTNHFENRAAALVNTVAFVWHVTLS